MDRGDGRAKQVHGVTQSGTRLTRLSTHRCTSHRTRTAVQDLRSVQSEKEPEDLSCCSESTVRSACLAFLYVGVCVCAIYKCNWSQGSPGTIHLHESEFLQPQKKLPPDTRDPWREKTRAGWQGCDTWRLDSRGAGLVLSKGHH